MLEIKDFKEYHKYRLLEVDKDLIMPRKLVGLILVTSTDVLHSCDFTSIRN